MSRGARGRAHSRKPLQAPEDDLRASENTQAPLCGEPARRARATVTAERYRVLVFERQAPLRGGEGVRLTRMDVEPSAVDDTIEAFGDTAVPWLGENPRFPSPRLFAHPAPGHPISEI